MSISVDMIPIYQLDRFWIFIRVDTTPFYSCEYVLDIYSHE
jgi:hypothetical protein